MRIFGIKESDEIKGTEYIMWHCQKTKNQNGEQKFQLAMSDVLNICDGD